MKEYEINRVIADYELPQFYRGLGWLRKLCIEMLIRNNAYTTSISSLKCVWEKLGVYDIRMCFDKSPDVHVYMRVGQNKAMFYYKGKAPELAAATLTVLAIRDLNSRDS